MGDAEFSAGLQQLNATLTQIECGVRSCDRLSSLGVSVRVSAVETDILHELELVCRWHSHLYVCIALELMDGMSIYTEPTSVRRTSP